MVQKWIQIIVISFLAFEITIPKSALSQYLIRTDRSYSQSIHESNLTWKHFHGQNLFAVVPTLKQLDKIKIDYKILDNDVETGAFYWIETRFDATFKSNEISQSSKCRILWHDQRSALVRSMSTKFAGNLPRTYMCKFINFKNLPQNLNTNFPSKNSIQSNKLSSIIQTVLDSVNIDQIYLTERHLTGEESFLNNGQADSIMTRYSYSPEIFKAENYIVSRLENVGLPVELQEFIPTTFNDIQFAPDIINSGWLVANDRIYGANNHRHSWSVQNSETAGAAFWSVFPVSHQIVYAIGAGGNIVKSSNSGNIWQTQVSPTNSYLFGVYFINERLGWICGDEGLVIKTTDGGTSWNIKNTPTVSRLYDIFFIDNNTGWTVGRDGAILYTNDAGESWTAQTSGISSRLCGVHFLNNSTGLAIGWDGKILRTDNGGAVWSSVLAPINEHFYDIDFIDQSAGMIVGRNGACLISRDGGGAWKSAGNIFEQDIYRLDIVDESSVWAVGNGNVVKSVDFGNNWRKVQNFSDGYLNNIIAMKQGTTYPDLYYIICAHYDATSRTPMVRAPGADDNGSGTAAVIEAARVLVEYDFKYSIKFVLFPAEEQGLIGSRVYANAALMNGEQILGVINLDMIGYDGNNDGSMEIHAGVMGASQAIANFVNSNIANWGLPLNPELKTFYSSLASDHSSFWNAGYPAILIIEDFSDFTPDYHTTNDLLSTLRPGYFLANVRLAIGSLALLAEIDSLSTSISNDGQIPKEFILYNPYPNPFNPLVQVEYYLSTSEKVVVEVCNLLGQSIKELVNQREDLGSHQITWDGTTNRGIFAPSGIYFVRMQSANQTQTRKIILIR